MRIRIAGVLAALVTITLSAQTGPTTLKELHNTARPLLIFGGVNDVRAGQQISELAAHARDLLNRDVRVILIDTVPHPAQELAGLPSASFLPPEEAYARQQFHVRLNEFAVVLVGKDGGEKMRSSNPIPWQTLASTIDAMPMRREETHR